MVPSFEHVSSPSTDDGLVEDWDADSVRSLTLAKLSLRPGSAVDSGAPSPTLPKSTLSTCSTSTAPSSSGAPPDAPDAPEPEDAAAQCPTGLPKIQSSSSAEGTPTREELRAAELVALRERRGTLSPEEERAFEHELGDWVSLLPLSSGSACGCIWVVLPQRPPSISTP